jgi:hypothetical protein
LKTSREQGYVFIADDNNFVEATAHDHFDESVLERQRLSLPYFIFANQDLERRITFDPVTYCILGCVRTGVENNCYGLKRYVTRERLIAKASEQRLNSRSILVGRNQDIDLHWLSLHLIKLYDLFDSRILRSLPVCRDLSDLT